MIIKNSIVMCLCLVSCVRVLQCCFIVIVIMYDCYAGACWSFSATGAIEGINKIVTGSLVSLSEQELVDCDTKYNSGCGGGLMDYAYQFITENKGIDTEEDYSYQGRQDRCKKDKVCC